MRRVITAIADEFGIGVSRTLRRDAELLFVVEKAVPAEVVVHIGYKFAKETT